MTVLTFPQLTPSDLVITNELFHRRAKAHDLEAEVAAFHELSTLLTREPEAAIQRFLQIAMQLCEAGSAGLSVLTRDEDGEPIFRWDALAGAFAPYVGGTTPRNFSPCGLCLDAGSTVLVSRPARVFEYFNQAEEPIIEGLIVPLLDTARVPLGTLWVVSHDEREFDANDARVMEQLAVQLVLALKLLKERADHNRTIQNLEARVIDRDAVIQEVHHRVKNTIQSTTALLRLQARTVQSAEAKEVLNEAQTRLAVFAKVHELLYCNADNAQAVGMATLLGSLTEALRQSFHDCADRVRLLLNAENVVLAPDEAIPLALMANEAITNAYKHAFPGNRSGQIKVSLKRRSDGRIRFAVQDDGRGMGLAARSENLGLRLIRSFAGQLGADVSVESNGGTKLSLTFESRGHG